MLRFCARRIFPVTIRSLHALSSHAIEKHQEKRWIWPHFKKQSSFLFLLLFNGRAAFQNKQNLMPVFVICRNRLEKSFLTWLQNPQKKTETKIFLIEKDLALIYQYIMDTFSTRMPRNAVPQSIHRLKIEINVFSVNLV